MMLEDILFLGKSEELDFHDLNQAILLKAVPLYFWNYYDSLVKG